MATFTPNLPTFTPNSYGNRPTTSRTTVDITKDDLERVVFDDAGLSVVLKPNAAYRLTAPVGDMVPKSVAEDRSKYWKTDELVEAMRKRIEVFRTRRDNAIRLGAYDNVVTYGKYILAMDALIDDIFINEVEVP